MIEGSGEPMRTRVQFRKRKPNPRPIATEKHYQNDINKLGTSAHESRNPQYSAPVCGAPNRLN
jgi:hypothetical protein